MRELSRTLAAELSEKLPFRVQESYPETDIPPDDCVLCVEVESCQTQPSGMGEDMWLLADVTYRLTLFTRTAEENRRQGLLVLQLCEGVSLMQQEMVADRETGRYTSAFALKRRLLVSREVEQEELALDLALEGRVEL